MSGGMGTIVPIPGVMHISYVLYIYVIKMLLN